MTDTSTTIMSSLHRHHRRLILGLLVVLAVATTAHAQIPKRGNIQFIRPFVDSFNESSIAFGSLQFTSFFLLDIPIELCVTCSVV